ncbi:Hypothetical predicted protein [Octopus vulgaris]|uniref:Uncharacterized protein n=1 Tax=Octopus vulgaris TaxID=6645 RepID=A0AA36F815_OCTVU|nr:Hypothetical predicted protein [Octopus vulgaris]
MKGCLRLFYESTSIALAEPRKLTFSDTISRDSGLDIKDLNTAMQDRVVWKGIVNGVPTNHRCCRKMLTRQARPVDEDEWSEMLTSMDD